MREIKYRAWDNLNKVMLTFEKGYLLQLQLDGKGQVSWKVIDRGLMCQTLSSWDKDSDGNDANNVLMQYTGLKDKTKDKEIYGDDKVVFTIFDHEDIDTQYEGVIKFAEGEWQIWPKVDGKYDAEEARSLFWIHKQDDEFEVTSNIHTTPEILEKKE